MRVRKISVLTLAAVAVGLSLTACDNGGTDKAASSTAGSAASTSSSKTGTGQDTATRHASPRTAGDSQEVSNGSTRTAPPGTPNKSGVKCTDQINYAGDSRSNADINSIGEKTGYCPPARHQ